MKGQPHHGTARPRGTGVEARAMLQRFGGDQDILSQLSEVFLREYSRQLCAVRDALDAQDAMAVARSAHTLKGSVGVFGAKSAVDAAQTLETAGRNLDLSRGNHTYAILEAEVTFLAQQCTVSPDSAARVGDGRRTGNDCQGISHER